MWWCELPSHMSGAKRHLSATGVSLTRRMTSPSSSESVNTGMCLPCCSSAAMGKMIGVVFGNAATAGHASSGSSMSEVPGGKRRRVERQCSGRGRVVSCGKYGYEGESKGGPTMAKKPKAKAKKPTKYTATDGVLF